MLTDQANEEWDWRPCARPILRLFEDDPETPAVPRVLESQAGRLGHPVEVGGLGDLEDDLGDLLVVEELPEAGDVAVIGQGRIDGDLGRRT